MDDIEICSNQSVTKDKIGYDIRMIQNINPMYINKVLEKKYLYKLFGNVYVTGIDNINISDTTYQNPNDNTFIVDVSFSIVGIIYYKNMQIAFVLDNMIDVNNTTFFRKGNLCALVNGLTFDEHDKTIVNGISNPIIITKVTFDPNYWPDNNILSIGVVCDLVKLINDTPENRKTYNIKV